MEKKSVVLHRYLSLIMLMLLIIREVSGDSFYFVIDGSKKIKVPCYGCPAGREPHHTCGHTYTKQENDKMDKECNFCKPGFYKKLSLGEYSSDKCIACVPCFGYKVIRECHPMYGRECSLSECEVDHYMSDTGCHKCCHCPADGIKEIGCKNSPSKKSCRADANGTCRQLAHTSTPKVSVLTNTTKPVNVPSSKVSILTKTTKPVNVFSSSATSEAATSTKLSGTTNQKRVTSTKSPTPAVLSSSKVSILSNATKPVNVFSSSATSGAAPSTKLSSTTNQKRVTSTRRPTPERTESDKQQKDLSIGKIVGIVVGILVVVVIVVLTIVFLLAKRKKKCCFRERTENIDGVTMQPLILTSGTQTEQRSSSSGAAEQRPSSSGTQTEQRSSSSGAAEQRPSSSGVTMQPLILTSEDIKEQEKCIECQADASTCIWEIEQSYQKFEQIWKHIPHGDIYEKVYRTICNSSEVNPGVSSLESLRTKLRAEEPDLKVASLLYVLYHLKQKAAVKKMHIVLHG